VTTLKVFEDNVLIRKVLEETVTDGVLVIDGGGSHRCALLGGNLSRLACENGWAGIIVYGCIRDSVEINELPIGLRALHTHPLKSHKRGTGDRDKLISFAGINFRTGNYVYVDEDGIVVADEKLI
jgi:regulator of ribonuclease activity A